MVCSCFICLALASMLVTSLPLSAQECNVTGPESTATLRRGQVIRHTLKAEPALQYFLYLPCRYTQEAPVVVTVHGISRNAEEHARYFAPYAERYGAILVAPLFSRQHFSDYQQLGRKGTRADTALDTILDEVQQVTGVQTKRFYLFGYSGGGQFGQRYTMAHPHRVLRLVLGAPGWYTFPDPHTPYPRGLKGSSSLPGVQFDLQQFLKVPTCVLVGEGDVDHDDSLRDSKRLNVQQGTTRLGRGQRWIAAMQTAARAIHLDTTYSFQRLPRCDHSFSVCMKKGHMGQRVFTFFFPPVLPSQPGLHQVAEPVPYGPLVAP